MANITINTNDLTGVVFFDPVYRKDTIAFPGADTYAEGTILARRQVATAITAAADAGNTGDGTCTAATVVTGPVVPLVGAYNLECIAAATNGGTFKLEDPNGMRVATDLVMTAGAGTATVFEVAGMTFTVTDAATDFVAGDKFSLTVAADGDLVVFASDGVGGAQIPVAVLTYEIVQTGAADESASVMVGGKVRKDKLIIDADGDDSNVTAVVLDQLRSYGIIAVDVTELNIRDNYS